jgi:hypothetical protein
MLISIAVAPGALVFGLFGLRSFLLITSSIPGIRDLDRASLRVAPANRSRVQVQHFF